MNEIAVLWSVSQQCFHKESLLVHCSNNSFEAAGKFKPTDYKVVAVVQNDEQADQFIEKMRPIFARKESR